PMLSSRLTGAAGTGHRTDYRRAGAARQTAGISARAAEAPRFRLEGRLVMTRVPAREPRTAPRTGTHRNARADPGCRRPGRVDRRRQAAPDPARADLPACARPPADRGPARRRQDDARARAVDLARPAVQ